MLSIFVRHTAKCLKGDGTEKKPGLLAKKLTKKELRVYKSCQCPKYFTGTYNGKWYPRTSCDACTWKTAEEAVVRVQNLADGKITSSEAAGPHGTPLKDAVRSWAMECRNDEIKSLRFFEHLGEILLERAQKAGIVSVQEITPLFINEWRTSWMTEKSPRKKEPGLKLNTRKSRLRRLSHFLNHCVRMEYITESPMAKLKPTRRGKKKRRVAGQALSQPEDIATLPIDTQGDTNYQLIVSYIPQFFAPKRVQGQLYKRRGALATRPDNFIALLQLMYTTGLRISDSLLFDIDAVRDARGGYGIYVTTQYKTDGAVTVVIEPWLLTKLRSLPRITGQYLFWDGRTPIERFECTQVGAYLREIGVKLGIRKLHAHRFRDSFAVNKLNDNWTMERLSKALGHKTVAITEMYYAPWVRSREDHHVNQWIDTPVSLPANIVEIPQTRPN